MSRPRHFIPRPPAEFLRALYQHLQLGCPEIGRLFERDSSTVRLWLLQDGTATRPRGSNPGPQFKPGQRTRLGIRHTREARRKIGEASKGRQPYLRKGQHWLHSVGPQDNPNWKGGATPERQAFYRSPEWKAACCAVWSRADACCERCDLDHRTVNRQQQKFHVHHIVSFAVAELRAEVSNLALLCRPCHLFVHSKANASREFLPPMDQVHYLKAAEQEFSMPTLFDFEAAEAA